MKTPKHAIAALALTLTCAAIPQTSKAQDATGALITAASGVAGLALGKEFEDKWGGAPYAGAALVPTLANWGYRAFQKKSDEEKIKYYISGANYQRWVHSQQTWYQSTLDPYTGRPQAFTGLNDMDSGMPENTNSSEEKTDITKVYTVPVKLPAGTYRGVPHTERMGAFPKLP